MHSFLRRHPLVLPIVALMLSSLIGIFLLAARIAIARHLRHLYLPWNLLLAWIPLILALIVRHLDDRALALPRRRPSWPILVAAIAWLLFLPNAPYILTDLVHLPDKVHRHYFADMMLILHFALTGLMLGFVSLRIMHGVAARRFGWIRGWCLAGLVTGLTGLGVYIGRFLRWNSWDVVVRPLDLLTDLVRWVLTLIDRPSELILPALFGSITFVAYVLFSSLLGPGEPRVHAAERHAA